MQRKLIVSLSLILLFLTIAGGVSWLLFILREPPPRVEISRPPLLVTTYTVKPESVTEWIEGYGTATADRLSVISAEVSGEVVKLPQSLRPGVQVTEGQVLLRLDDRDYRLALQRAESKLAGDQAQLAQLQVEAANIDRLLETAAREVESMKWEYEKVKELYEANTAPKREFAQTRRSYEQTLRVQQELENRKDLLPERRKQLEALIDTDKAEVEVARLNVERCTIKPPFDGRVDEVKVEVGERVQVGTPMITIVDPRWIDIPIELPLSAHDHVKIGAACELYLESRPETSWTGNIHRIAPVANEQTRTFKAYVLVDNQAQSKRMIPGVFMKARVEGPTLEGAIAIPRDATRRSRVFVYDARDQTADRRNIDVIEHVRDQSIVTGLEEGDLVITSNLDSLYDGMPVRIEAAPPAETPPLPQATANLTMDNRSESP